MLCGDDEKIMNRENGCRPFRAWIGAGFLPRAVLFCPVGAGKSLSDLPKIDERHELVDGAGCSSGGRRKTERKKIEGRMAKEQIRG
jgi:hypothetical protein